MREVAGQKRFAVIRNGYHLTLPFAEVAPGDLVELTPGQWQLILTKHGTRLTGRLYADERSWHEQTASIHPFPRFGLRLLHRVFIGRNQ